MRRRTSFWPGRGLRSLTWQAAASVLREATPSKGRSRHYQLEKVRRGKRGCRKCAEGVAHGPYLYRYFRKDGRMRSEYVNNSPEHVAQAEQAGLYEAAAVKPPRS